MNLDFNRPRSISRLIWEAARARGIASRTRRHLAYGHDSLLVVYRRRLRWTFQSIGLKTEIGEVLSCAGGFAGG